ncbi:nephronophthisis 4, putative [Ichthyophthirius multifiliis]|uniref:Nephronophthisis 4, putative n=1 Tax=Ichthyophthirius multifiliis TaxID=5932 RepID=G0QJ50_ICHMU|nr:nephronophthisis 4, putative [Ichthyophthirius multifiliis]EGR34774.1 nephronophthisis 4, putative [Ichthyophthirius multifiliis]|eukprot:XP_004040078.1 nephronophthisis 4, putative [Ichthyophthirius multifiliis]
MNVKQDNKQNYYINKNKQNEFQQQNLQVQNQFQQSKFNNENQNSFNNQQYQQNNNNLQQQNIYQQQQNTYQQQYQQEQIIYKQQNQQYLQQNYPYYPQNQSNIFNQDLNKQQQYYQQNLNLQKTDQTFYQTQQQEFQRQITYDDPFRVFFSQPQYEKMEYTEEEIVQLINNNLFGLLDDVVEQNAQIEITNEDMKHTLISFNIISFKAKSYQSLPKNFYLTTKFFNFPLYVTYMFTYQQANDQDQIKQIISNKKPLFFIKKVYEQVLEMEQKVQFQFEIQQQNKNNQQNIYQEFAFYCAEKSLIIDVWDADSHFLYGTCKFALRDILRNKQKRKNILIDLDVIDESFMGLKGELQIQIDNICKEKENSEYTLENQLQNIKDLQKNNIKDIKTIQNKKRGNKIKVVSTNSISLPQNQLKKPENINLNDENFQKLERVKHFKNASLNRKNQDDNYFQVNSYRISQINEFKQKKKPQFIQGIISQFLQEEKNLKVQQGNLQIIPFTFQNCFEESQCFQITIESQFKQKNQFSLISDPQEWRYFTQLYQVKPPQEFDIIHNNTIILQSQEEVVFLFKFLSYSDQNEENGQKLINVYFSLQNNIVQGGFKLNITQDGPSPNHVFRFYEKYQTPIQLTLPPLFLAYPPPEKNLEIHITNPDVEAQWVNSRQILFFTKMGEIGHIKKFFVYLYSSVYREQLLGTFQIELHSIDGFNVNVVMAQSTNIKIQIQGDIPRTIKLYSSHSDILWFPFPFDKQFYLQPGRNNLIDVTIKSMRNNTQRVKINAVDEKSNQLIYSWIVKIDTQLPEITQSIQLFKNELNNNQILFFDYMNQHKKSLNFIFISSDPTVLNVINTQQFIQANFTEQIQVQLMENKDKVKTKDVLIFVSDFEEIVFETIHEFTLTIALFSILFIKIQQNIVIYLIPYLKNFSEKKLD